MKLNKSVKRRKCGSALLSLLMLSRYWPLPQFKLPPPPRLNPWPDAFLMCEPVGQAGFPLLCWKSDISAPFLPTICRCRLVPIRLLLGGAKKLLFDSNLCFENSVMPCWFTTKPFGAAATFWCSSKDFYTLDRFFSE